MLILCVVLWTGESLAYGAGIGRRYWFFASAVAVVVVTYGWYRRVARKVYTSKEGHVGAHPEPDASRVRARLNELDGRLDATTGDAQARFYFQMILDPADRVLRIKETVAPSARSYELTTAHTVLIPEAIKESPFALPLFLAPKQFLVNRLRLEGPDGDHCATLLPEIAIAQSVFAARRYVAQVQRGSYLADYKANIEPDIIALLCRLDVFDGTDQKLRAIVSSIDALAKNKGSRAKLALVIRYLHRLGPDRPVVIIEPAAATNGTADVIGGDVTCRYKVQRRLIPLAGAASRRRDRFRDYVRLMCGVQSAQIVFRLKNAELAQSYHLEVAGPEGTYLARQALVDYGGSQSDALAGLRYGLLPRLWQRFGHLYINGYRPAAPEAEVPNGPARPVARLFYLARFYERAPGSIAPATLSAFSAAALITVTAFGRLSDQFELSSDLVVVLLSLPIVAGAWLGFDSQSSIFVGSLNARLSLGATMILSLCSSAYYLFAPRPDKANGDFAKFWPHRPGAYWWEWLVSLAVLNFLAAASSWWLRASVQRHFIGRSGSEWTEST